MLEFTKEEISGNLVAHSETTEFKTYWIEVRAWSYLITHEGGNGGPKSRTECFTTTEDAIKAANEMESET